MSIVNSGDTKISKEIEFLDSSTLGYRQIQYVFTWEGAGPHWEEQEILEEEVYSVFDIPRVIEKIPAKMRLFSLHLAKDLFL